jgi:hypothetical protein
METSSRYYLDEQSATGRGTVHDTRSTTLGSTAAYVFPRRCLTPKEIPPRELAKAAKISERAVKAIRNGYAAPRSETCVVLKRAAMTSIEIEG